MRSQLSFDDVLGTFDYKAKSTAEQFLAKTPVITTYAVEFYDKEEKQRIDWFEVKNRDEAEGAAKGTHGYKIQIIRIYVSDKTLEEIMKMD